VTPVELTAIGSCALLASAVITGLVRRFALAHDVIDVPNERSSHHRPTPRGGGASIVVATTLALAVLGWLGALRSELLLAMIGGGIAVAVVGFVDDQRPVSAAVRFGVHLAAAIWALIWLGPVGPLRLGDYTIPPGWWGYVVGLVGLVWMLNLFNFMDGIDGIAASEAVFVAWCGALLTATLEPVSAGVSAAAAIFGASCLGFLCWNWPPARIFMGDVGSGYLGYVIGVLALAATRTDPVALWVWLILAGVFFVDATVTLLRRLLHGERIYQAHRTHAYQRLARCWQSHGKVTLAVIGVNFAWLLPCAVLAARLPRYAALCALVALAPLALLALLIGAGCQDGEAR
jgi:Fuc2NAc and GlcNAc transferase